MEVSSLSGFDEVKRRDTVIIATGWCIATMEEIMSVRHMTG